MHMNILTLVVYFFGPAYVIRLCISLHTYYIITGAAAYLNARYGQGSGPILMDDVACTGTENGLIDCNFDNTTGDCSHSEDAAVRCFFPPTTGEH